MSIIWIPQFSEHRIGSLPPGKGSLTPYFQSFTLGTGVSLRVRRELLLSGDRKRTLLAWWRPPKRSLTLYAQSFTLGGAVSHFAVPGCDADCPSHG
jgi:hypothetical protein